MASRAAGTATPTCACRPRTSTPTNSTTSTSITDGDDVGAYDYTRRSCITAARRSARTARTPSCRWAWSIGQRDGLSAGDVAAIRSIYPDLERPLLFPHRRRRPATLVARAVLDFADVLGRTGHAAIALAVHPTLNQRVLLGSARRLHRRHHQRAHPEHARQRDAALLAADVAAGAGGQLHRGRHADVARRRRVPFIFFAHHIVFSNNGDRPGWPATAASTAATGLAAFRLRRAGRRRARMRPTRSPEKASRSARGPHRRQPAGHGIAEQQSGAAWRYVGSGERRRGLRPDTSPGRFVHQVERGRWRSSDECSR